MSHNLYTLNNEGGNVQCYHGANDGVIYIGRGETQTYAGTLNPSTNLTTAFEFYDSNPINTISGASFTKRAGTNWIQSFTLPAGSYELRSSCLAPTFNAGGPSAVTLAIFKSSAQQYRSGILNYSPTYGDDNYQYVRSDTAVFTLSTTTTLSFSIFRVTIHSQKSQMISDDRISETAYVFIRKVG